jgi:fructokinase
MSDDIMCVGELLWDALPEGLFLGGAPFNVASHLHALGEEVLFVSRVGDDRLGEEARRRLPARGLDTDLVQTDGARPTGFVRVALDADTGEPDYEIVAPAAWDAIAFTDAVRRHAKQINALVFGSLAQRAAPSRQTIQRLCETEALCVFDVNLRPPHVARTVVEQSLRAADVVKVNEAELDRLRAWFALSEGEEAALADLAETFDCSTVCVTQGREGARLWQNGDCVCRPGYSVEVADPVGAGDAFLAALLSGLLDGRGGADLLDLAHRLGAYVASQSGAVPSYEADALDDIGRLPLDG